MTELIPRDAAIAAVTALIDRANKQGLPSVAIIAMSCRQDICTIPTIDPAAIREAALREAAAKIQEKVIYLKDQDRELALSLAIYGRDAILALIGEKK